MASRITMSLRADGELWIYLNPEGRDWLVEALQRLDEGDEHFHFGPEGSGLDLEVSPRPYSPDEKIIESGKVLFRTDEWDRQYFPHVFSRES